MPRVIDRLVLSPDQRSELQRWVVALGTPQQVALRCRIILAVAAGKTELAIAAENGVNRKTVRLWRERFRSAGLQALWEIAPGRGRKPSYDATRIKAVIDATLQTKPKGNTHWSCRTMAVAQRIGKSSVSRIWRSHNFAAIPDCTIWKKGRGHVLSRGLHNIRITRQLANHRAVQQTCLPTAVRAIPLSTPRRATDYPSSHILELVGCAANGNPLHSVQRRSIRCTPPDARGDCRDCSPSRVRCTPRFRSKSLKHLDKYAFGFCHSPTWPRGAVTRTDENGGLDKVGKLEVDPQRIRGRSSVGALRSPSVNLVRTWTIVAEVGVDLGTFIDAKHLTSWAGLCPGNRESGGKRMSGRTRKANRYLKRAMCQAAWAASHTKNSYLSAFYRRMSVRKGRRRRSWLWHII